MKRGSVLLVLSLAAGSVMMAAEKSPAAAAAKESPVVLSKLVVSGTRIPSGWFTIAWETKGPLPLDPIKRVWVSNLMPGSPAESAGVQIGDRVIAIQIRGSETAETRIQLAIGLGMDDTTSRPRRRDPRADTLLADIPG